MLAISDCIPGMPVKSIYGSIGIIASRPFKYHITNLSGYDVKIINSVKIICGDDSIIQHANLEAFSVYRGKHDTHR